MIEQLVAAIVGYLIGSFPTAYLLVKWKADVDIRSAGSGNVGTLNSYEVTNSKVVGLFVLVADVLKGVLAVVAARAMMGSAFSILAAAGVGAVVGHNFPVWLKFKGGRGLATAAGVMLMLGWVVVAAWGVIWFIGKITSKDVNVGNAIATMAILILVWLAPPHVIARISYHSPSAGTFALFATIMMMVILVRLVGPVREYLASRRL